MIKEQYSERYLSLNSKAVARRPATLLKQRLWHRCFPVNFAKFLRTPFLTFCKKSDVSIMIYMNENIQILINKLSIKS